ncbi:MAG: HNH endonuclease [Spirulinaceae cyanobacterium]
MTTYISSALRRQVIARANDRCEYCRFPQSASLFAFEMEHIIAEKHRGESTFANLALACPYCNRAKGTDLGSIDPQTNQLTPFFNPRTQGWYQHFECLDDATISPYTAVGRVTVLILKFNESQRIQERQRLLTINQYPQ